MSDTGFGTDFTGELAPPPPPPPKVVPEVTPTLSLVAPLRAAQKEIGLRVMAPLKVAKQSRVRRVRSYKIGGKAPTVKIVFETGFRKYWGMSMTTLDDPPILDEDLVIDQRFPVHTVNQGSSANHPRGRGGRLLRSRGDRWIVGRDAWHLGLGIEPAGR